MPRPARPWFRFYVEALSDRKLRRLTPAQRWLWVAVLGAARQSPIPGHLMVSEREPMDAHDLADKISGQIKDPLGLQIEIDDWRALVAHIEGKLVRLVSGRESKDDGTPMARRVT